MFQIYQLVYACRGIQTIQEITNQKSQETSNIFPALVPHFTLFSKDNDCKHLGWIFLFAHLYHYTMSFLILSL